MTTGALHYVIINIVLAGIPSFECSRQKSIRLATRLPALSKPPHVTRCAPVSKRPFTSNRS